METEMAVHSDGNDTESLPPPDDLHLLRQHAHGYAGLADASAPSDDLDGDDERRVPSREHDGVLLPMGVDAMHVGSLRGTLEGGVLERLDELERREHHLTVEEQRRVAVRRARGARTGWKRGFLVRRSPPASAATPSIARLGESGESRHITAQLHPVEVDDPPRPVSRFRRRRQVAAADTPR
eukprot:ctg_2227.g435